MPNSIWFSKNNLVERPSPDYVLCVTCKNRVALVDDHIWTVQAGGIFNGVYNVEVNNHETQYGSTIANVYCVQCGMHLGWKFITLPQPHIYAKEGRFFMDLHKLSYWNGEPLLLLDKEQDLDANEKNAYQDGEATDQDGDANDENTDEDGDATDEDGYTTDQDGDATDEEGDTTDQDGDTSEQELDANKENIDPNEQHADQDDDED